MTRVLVLGAGGMLGSMVARILEAQPGLEVIRTARSADSGRSQPFDAVRDSVEDLLRTGRYDWIVNAIGILKGRIDEEASRSVAEAIEVNALFPHRLAAAAAERGQRVIQIATDGVFSGADGPYDEAAPHDAHDIYGKTKSLGEVSSPHVVNLRCSIVGPELAGPSSLLGWLIAQPPNAQVRGYTAQRWNGVTTLHFSRLCIAIMSGVSVPSPQHVVPADVVTKADLLGLALRAFGRGDVEVLREPGPEAADRTLTTANPLANQRLWQAAGYREPPTIEGMLAELAAAHDSVQ